MIKVGVQKYLWHRECQSKPSTSAAATAGALYKYALDDDERIEIALRTVEKVRGRARARGTRTPGL